MSSEVQTVYHYNEKGWRTYDPENLSKEQCPLALQDCKDSAYYERCKAVIVNVGAVLGAAALVSVGFVVANIVTPLFVGVLVDLNITEAALTIASISSHTMVYTFTIAALHQLWRQTVESVQFHWNYAHNFDLQALNIKFRLSELES